MKNTQCFKTLFLTLVACLVWAGAAAEDVCTALVPGKYYAFRHLQAGSGTVGEVRYMCVNGTVLNADARKLPSGQTLNDRKYIFTVEDAGDGKYFIRNVGTGYYLHRPGKVGNNTNVSTNSVPTIADNAYWITNSIVSGQPTIFAFGDAVQMANGPVPSEQYFLHNNNSDANASVKARVVRWSVATTAGNNSQWYVEEVTDMPDYFVNYAADATSGHSSRYPGKITVTTSTGAQEQTWATAARHALYKDCTESFVVNVKAGEQFTIAYAGGSENWMQFYAYLDYGRDGQFSWDVDKANHRAQIGSDLVAWSCFSFGQDGGWDSDGTAYADDNRNTRTLPGSISAPSVAGDYRVRVKVDWNNIDPAGALASNPGGAMQANGGGILDFTLRVTGSAYNLTFEDAYGQAMNAVRVYTPSGTSACGAEASINSEITELMFVTEDWQLLKAVAFRAAGNEYGTWGEVRDAVGATDIVVVLEPSAYNIVAGHYYALRHVQCNTGALEEVRYAHVNGTEMNADVTGAPDLHKDLTSVFRFVDAGSGLYYLYNAGTNLYVRSPGAVGEGVNIPTSPTATNANNAYYVTNAVVPENEDAFALGDASMLRDPLAQVSERYYMHNTNETVGNRSKVVRWSTSHVASNSLWYLDEVTIPVVTLTFVEGDQTVTPSYTIVGGDNTLTAQSQMLAWSEDIVMGDAYVVTGWVLNGMPYDNKPAFFEAMRALTADATATLTLQRKDYYPQVDGSYLIAAQTWNGSKWVERMLVNSSGTTLGQTTNFASATEWTVESGSAAGTLRLKSASDKYIMYGGLSISAADVVVAEPTDWTSGQSDKSLTIFSQAGTQTEWRYVIARNSGDNFESGDKTSTETGFFPKTTAYTPYYRFYDASQHYLTITENMPVAATYKADDEPLATDAIITMESLEGKTLSVNASAYNTALFDFVGFYEGDTPLGVTYTIPTGQTTSRNIEARFAWHVTSSVYGEKWVTIRNNALGTYAATFDDNGTTRIKPMALGNGDAYKWCFVPAEGGMYIYNKDIGDGKVVTLDATAGNGTAISMQPIDESNAARQLWTFVYDGTSVGIVPANHTSRGWNPFQGNTNPLKLYDVTGANSRWQLIETGKSLFTDRENNYIEDGVLYTFISAYSEYYNRQKVLKAVYLDTSSNRLRWKTYDPQDDAFYFRAHISETGVLTMECLGKPGYYIAGAASEVTQTGGVVTFTNLGNGICNIKIGSEASFHTNNHGSGSGGDGNIIAYAGGVGSASVWYVQRANSKASEVARYQQELADRQAAIDEAARQAKRAELKAAIDACIIGYEFGQYPPEAIEAAQAVYDDPDKTTAEYQDALTALQGSINPPLMNTYFQIKSAFAWNDGEPRVICSGKNKELRWEHEKESLYQLWRVAAVDENDHSRIALLNMGSGTYMKAISYNGGTTTTTEQTFVKLAGAGNGIFYIQSLTAANGNTRFHAGDHSNGSAAEGRVMLWDGNNDRNTWIIEEMSEMDMSVLAYDEDNRQAERANLLTLINDIKLHTTANGAIGYYNTLGEAIEAAQGVYDDESNTKQEYLDAMDALRTAYESATPIAPVVGQTYALVKADGSLAMYMDNAEAEEDYGRIALNMYDDTDATMLWTIARGEGNAYIFTCGEVSVTLNLTAVGNDQYEIEDLSDVYGNFIIRPCALATNYNYLTNGIYRIVNASTGKALSNNGILVAQTTMADVDESNTDHLQLWTVTKAPGADRYILQNVETGRHLGQSEITVGRALETAPLPSVFHLEASDTEGQYYIYTTRSLSTQLCISSKGTQPQLRGADQNAKWMFVPVEPAEKPVVSYQAVRIRNRGNATHYMSAVEYNVQHKTINIANNDQKDMWVLVPHDFMLADSTTQTRYAIRNAFSGLYMQNVTANNQKVTAGTTPVYYIKTVGTLDATAVEFKSPTNEQKLNASGQNEYIIGWNGADDTNSHWYIEDVEGVTFTEDELMIRADAFEGFCAPRDGLICRIYNPTRGDYLDEDYNARGPRHSGLNTSKYTQLWRLHYDDAEAMYTLENLYTGDYIKNQPSFNVQYLMTDDVATAGTFTLACNPTIVGQRIYNIIDSRSGRYMHAQSTGLCVTWTAGSNSISASEWRFRPVELTDEEIAAIKAKWEENRNMTQNVGTYQAIFDEIFADKACTVIREDLTDERYDELVASLPDMLADMCDKIKNNTWHSYTSGRNWEKAFRIANHSVVSNSSGMTGVTGVGYQYSRLTDPTGIKAAANEVVAIMVDSDVPAGASLRLECQSGWGMSGSQYTLHRGLNLIAMEQLTNMFIYYMINSAADNPANYLENFPDIKIHIEGGEVFGMLNRTRVFEVERTETVGEGEEAVTNTITETYDMRSHNAYTEAAHTAWATADSLWVRMQRDGLLRNGDVTQVVSDCMLFNFDRSEFLAACPEKIGEVTDIWDWIIKSEQWAMGLRNDWTLEGQNGEVIDTYIPNLSHRFNNVYMACERSGGYMNASGYGAMYTVGTARSILNFDALKSGGAQWGPAHEHGHDHQLLIDMIGMGEVSNNLLANIANYKFGTLVSRGASLPDVMNNYLNGGHWFDLSIWNMTQMYFKLFLYYHGAHNNDNFYPLVFKRLRDGKRIDKTQGKAVRAADDYLHFIQVCAEVAGEDLSDFAEAYGMFREISSEVSPNSNISWEEKGGHICRYVGDYGNYYVYTTPEMLAECRESIRACGPRNTSVLFCDDRIVREESTSPFANEGDMKSNRGDGGVVGNYGNVGQYSDMDPTRDDYDPNKTTGFMIYDEDGNLLYFTGTGQTTTDDEGNEVIVPVIPPAVVDAAGGEENIVIGEVEANGDIIEQCDPEDEVFTLITYIYNSASGEWEEDAINTAGRLRPVLQPNEILMVKVRDDIEQVAEARILYSRDHRAAARRVAANVSVDDYHFATLDNVVLNNGSELTMHSLNVTDMVNLYLPDGIEAHSVTYIRNNTAGWNSVCLPFAVTAEDFGEGAVIYTLGCHDDESITLVPAPEEGVEAGVPCFVRCADNVTSWSISRDYDDLVTTTVDVNVADGIQLNGSFVNTTIGEGRYKLNGAGTVFGRTTESGQIAAFRSYVESADDMPPLLAPAFVLRIDDNPATGVGATEHVMQAGQMYDLDGRQVNQIERGKPYILNGRICIDK